MFFYQIVNNKNELRLCQFDSKLGDDNAEPKLIDTIEVKLNTHQNQTYLNRQLSLLNSALKDGMQNLEEIAERVNINVNKSNLMYEYKKRNIPFPER